MPATSKKNLYLFYGSDNYSAQQKLNHWRQEFEKKYGDLNIQIFDGESLTASAFNEALMTLPFLSDKKFIVIRDFLQDAKENDQKEVAEKLEDIPDYCVIVFLERSKPDARTTLFKKLNKIGQAVQFDDLEKSELVTWIQQEMAKKQTKIGSREAGLLAEAVGPNLWQMSHELEKLALYAQDQPINEQVIEGLVSPNLSSSIFKLTDYLAQKNARMSLKTLRALIQGGEDPFQIFFMIVRHFRILIQIRACLEQKLDRPQIIQKTKEHPYAVMTGMSQCKNFSSEKLAQIYRKLLQIDIDAKSGKIKTTTGDISELRLSLEKFMVELCA